MSFSARVRFPFALSCVLFASACQQVDDADASASQQASTDTAELDVTLAVTDCAAAAALFGDHLQGMKPMSVDVPDDTSALNCQWSTPLEGAPLERRSLMLQVYLGKHLADEMFDDQALALSGMRRIPAPEFDRRGGLAFTHGSESAMGYGSQHVAQLPTAQVAIQTGNGADVPAGQRLDDADAVTIAAKLLRF